MKTTYSRDKNIHHLTELHLLLSASWSLTLRMYNIFVCFLFSCTDFIEQRPSWECHSLAASHCNPNIYCHVSKSGPLLALLYVHPFTPSQSLSLVFYKCYDPQIPITYSSSKWLIPHTCYVTFHLPWLLHIILRPFSLKYGFWSFHTQFSFPCALCMFHSSSVSWINRSVRKRIWYFV